MNPLNNMSTHMKTKYGQAIHDEYFVKVNDDYLMKDEIDYTKIFKLLNQSRLDWVRFAYIAFHVILIIAALVIPIVNQDVTINDRYMYAVMGFGIIGNIFLFVWAESVSQTAVMEFMDDYMYIGDKYYL